LPVRSTPELLALNATKQLNKVRIWDGSRPWLIHGYDAIRTVFTDLRTSADDGLPGYPHWNTAASGACREASVRARVAYGVYELWQQYD
jgi:hypothetical protein